MQNGQANGQAKVKTGVPPLSKAIFERPLKPAQPPGPPPSPFTFVDELPAKIRSLVQGAVEAVQADQKYAADRRYLDGMRRGAFLISMSIGSLDGDAKKKVSDALDQLETELDAEEKKLRESRAK